MTSNYPDWLNPMLVKELRQGLSKGMFTGVFVLVQVVMIMFLGVRLLTADADVDQYLGGFMDGILRTGLGMILLLVLPARGLAAIQEEKKIQTLELVQMTRLNSQRIVWGKWVAIMGQILLFTVAVLPYGVLRYFLGGMEILDTLSSLGAVLLWSMTITAFCIWLSAMGAGARILAVIFAFVAFQYVTLMSFRLMGSGSISLGPDSALAGVLSAVITTVFFLAMAAARIASVAENHAVMLRGIALVAGMVALTGTLLAGSSWAFVGLPVMVWSMFLALTEVTSEVPSMYAPWLRWGLPGRIACRIMNPGWASGLIFSAIIMAIIAACDFLGDIGQRRDLLGRAFTFAMCYLALAAPVCLLTVSLNVRHRGIVYLCVQGGCALLLAIGSASAERSGVAFDSFTPTGAALWMLSHGSTPGDAHWLTGGIVAFPIGLVCLLVLLWRSIREFKLMSKQEAKVTSAKALS